MLGPQCTALKPSVYPLPHVSERHSIPVVSVKWARSVASRSFHHLNLTNEVLPSVPTTL